MKQNNLDRLYLQYITGKTSPLRTKKIEASLAAIKKRNIHWMSDETEELLSQKIRDQKSSPKEVHDFIKSLSKMRIADVKWMRFKGIDVYFSKEAY